MNKIAGLEDGAEYDPGEEYHAFVKRLWKKDSTREMLIHASMGISGEAGELLDAVKKHVIYGKDLDYTNTVEELGDLFYYLYAMCHILQVDPGTVKHRNMYKLNKRYPKGNYSNDQAIARADKKPIQLDIWTV